MTEYWVSQGKKWCDYCKIYIANNATSLRNHEFGQRHKESVAQRLATMRKDNIAKEKEKLQALKDLERIEWVGEYDRVSLLGSVCERRACCGDLLLQAKKSYERDVAAAERLVVSKSDGEQVAGLPPEAPGGAPPAPAIPVSASSQPSRKDEAKIDDWTYDEKTGYHFNAATGYYYDPNSGLYFSDILGKWTTQEDAHQASQNAHAVAGVAPPATTSSIQTVSKEEAKISVHASTTATAKTLAKPSSLVPQGSLSKQKPQPSKVSRGVASSLELNKRKREEKAGPVSSEEVAALEAREAAKKRILDREKSLLGLYQAY